MSLFLNWFNWTLLCRFISTRTILYPPLLCRFISTRTILYPPKEMCCGFVCLHLCVYLCLSVLTTKEHVKTLFLFKEKKNNNNNKKPGIFTGYISMVCVSGNFQQAEWRCLQQKSNASTECVVMPTLREEWNIYRPQRKSTKKTKNLAIES